MLNQSPHHPDNKMPLIGLLVLNRDGRQWLTSVFPSLRQQDYPNKRIYLIDNGSQDDSLDLTMGHYPEVTIIRIPTNLGYAMAYNLAMPIAFADGCQWVIWANNDIRLEPECLKELSLAAQSSLNIGVIGPAFLSWDRNEPNAYMLGNHPYAIQGMKERTPGFLEVEWVEGSCLMVSRPCAEAVGPIDPFLYFYWEEADFCRRARLQGWRVVLAHRALARHYAGGYKEGNHKAHNEAYYLQTRNFYIYKMADPFRGFIMNGFSALHLFFVNLKQSSLRNPLDFLFHLWVFAKTLGEIRPIYQKWVRDRRGGHPPTMSSHLPPVTAEVILPREPESPL